MNYNEFDCILFENDAIKKAAISLYRKHNLPFAAGMRRLRDIDGARKYSDVKKAIRNELQKRADLASVLSSSKNRKLISKPIKKELLNTQRMNNFASRLISRSRDIIRNERKSRKLNNLISQLM